MFMLSAWKLPGGFIVRKYTFLLILLLLTNVLFAGTLFEDIKNISDPFVADIGGFNSFMINPAGTAGHSGFDFSVNGGFQSSINDLKLINALTSLALKQSSSGFTDANLMETVSVFSDLYNEGLVNDSLFNGLFNGVTMPVSDWGDMDQIESAISGLSDADMDQISSNINDIMEGTNAAFFSGLPSGNMNLDFLGSFKSGFLVNGWGFGIYNQLFSLISIDTVSPRYGIENVYNELGLMAGGAFKILNGKLALGVMGNYSLLMKSNSFTKMNDFQSLLSNNINYGYSWGVDIGAVWRLSPTLNFGFVLNDVAGFTQADTPYSAAGIDGFFSDQAYLMKQFDYKVTMDMDTGISWHPDWSIVKARFGADLYNTVSYIRDVAESGESYKDALYRSLHHLRLGADFTFFNFLTLGAQYNRHYISAGIGFDFMIMEILAEAKMNDRFIHENSFKDMPVAADLLIRFYYDDKR